MPEMFEMSYGDIFLIDNHRNVMDKEYINTITKNYVESNVNVEDKKNFLQLKKAYLTVTSIENYSVIQNQLYENKDRNEIISFELVRILEKAGDDASVVEQVSSVNRILSLHDEDMPDELYYKIINGIIKLELSLGMNIGLFRELCLLFENKVKEIDMKLNNNVITRSKSGRKK